MVKTREWIRRASNFELVDRFRACVELEHTSTIEQVRDDNEKMGYAIQGELRGRLADTKTKPDNVLVELRERISTLETEQQYLHHIYTERRTEYENMLNTASGMGKRILELETKLNSDRVVTEGLRRDLGLLYDRVSYGTSVPRKDARGPARPQGPAGVDGSSMLAQFRTLLQHSVDIEALTEKARIHESSDLQLRLRVQQLEKDIVSISLDFSERLARKDFVQNNMSQADRDYLKAKKNDPRGSAKDWFDVP